MAGPVHEPVGRPADAPIGAFNTGLYGLCSAGLFTCLVGFAVSAGLYAALRRARR